MRHILISTGDHKRFWGYEVPDDVPDTVTWKECNDARYHCTGPWHKCVECGNVFSQWGYGNTSQMHGYRDLNDNFYCVACGDKHRVALRDKDAPRPKIEIEVPALYTMASLNDFPAKHRRVIEKWPFAIPLLGIVGIPGSGKSHCCWSIAKDMANRGRRATIISAIRMRETWLAASKSMLGPEHLVHRWHTTAWLIIDDLSASSGTDGWVAFLHDLLDERLNNDRPTLISTAGRGEEIESKYSKAVRSRLQGFHWLELPRTDWRAVKRKIRHSAEKAVAPAQENATVPNLPQVSQTTDVATIVQ